MAAKKPPVDPTFVALDILNAFPLTSMPAVMFSATVPSGERVRQFTRFLTPDRAIEFGMQLVAAGKTVKRRIAKEG